MTNRDLVNFQKINFLRFVLKFKAENGRVVDEISTGLATMLYLRFIKGMMSEGVIRSYVYNPKSSFKV